MFGNQHSHFRPAFAGVPDEGETAFYGQRGRRGGPPLAARLWMMRRHFPFGGPRGPRMFGRGDLKFVLLELLQERPKHGYEMIKELETKAGGFYTPSAGAIYPTLQLLEDRGWVTSQTVDGKKVFTITDAGRTALKENEQQHEEGWGGPWEGRGRHGYGPRGPFDAAAAPEMQALRQEGMEVARLMWAALLASGGDPQRLAQLRTIVARARGDLEAFVGQDQQTPHQPQQPGTAPDKADLV